MFKVVLFVSSVFLSGSVFADSFNDFKTNLVKVGGYAQNVNYESQHCIITFSENAPSSCKNKYRGIIYLEKNVGQLMCSVAMTAMVTDKKVEITSHDDCDPIHNSPVVRIIQIVN